MTCEVVTTASNFIKNASTFSAVLMGATRTQDMIYCTRLVVVNCKPG